MVCTAFLGEGKATIRSKTYSITEALRLLSHDARRDKALREGVGELLLRCEEEFTGKLADAPTLQAIWTGREKTVGFGPEDIVDALGSIIDAVFPSGTWSDRFVQSQSDDKFLPARGLRARIVAGLVGAAYCSELINGGPSSAVRKEGNNLKRGVSAHFLPPHRVLLAEALKNSYRDDEPALQLA